MQEGQQRKRDRQMQEDKGIRRIPYLNKIYQAKEKERGKKKVSIVTDQS